jgi:hypothetical protein
LEGFGLYSYGSGQETVTGSCEHGNKSSVSVKGGEFLAYLFASEEGLCTMELVILFVI